MTESQRQTSLIVGMLIVKITMVGVFQESAHSLKNNHENNSVEQKHSKREHHILFWIKMTTHLWIILRRSCIIQLSVILF